MPPRTTLRFLSKDPRVAYISPREAAELLELDRRARAGLIPENEGISLEDAMIKIEVKRVKAKLAAAAKRARARRLAKKAHKH